MNRLKLILVSGCTALLMAAALQAQTVTHYLTAEAGVGYSAGFLGEVGVGYAFADRLFLMRTGLEMAYTFRRMRVPDHTEQQGEGRCAVAELVSACRSKSRRTACW